MNSRDFEKLVQGLENTAALARGDKSKTKKTHIVPITKSDAVTVKRAPNRPSTIHQDQKMKTFEFTLRFQLPPGNPDPRRYLDALFEAGCDDATIGVGRPGVIALDFVRDAPTLDDAMATAIADVKRAIPGCNEAK